MARTYNKPEETNWSTADGWFKTGEYSAPSDQTDPAASRIAKRMFQELGREIHAPQPIEQLIKGLAHSVTRLC